MTSRIGIALIGFDSQLQAMLELFFSRRSDRYQTVPVDEADAMLVNVDNPRALPDAEISLPGIAVSSGSRHLPGMPVLKRPFSLTDLERALDELESRLGNRPEGARERETEEDLLSYRERLQRAQREREEAARLYRDLQRKKQIFQQQLLARKRAAEKHLKTLETMPQTSLKERLAQEQADGQASLGGVMAAAAQAPENPPTDRAAFPDFELQPASPHAVHDCCGHSPNLDLRDPAQRRRAFFNPEGQLLALCIQAARRGLAEQCPVAVEGLPHHHLIFLPDEQVFAADMDEDFLVQMAHLRFRFGELHLRPTGQAQARRISSEGAFASYPVEKLVWRLACWSSRGKLIAGIDPDAPYRLQRLPDPGILIGLPYTRQILELWWQEAISVDRLVHQLGAAQRYVFPIMTAAWVLGMLVREDQPGAAAQMSRPG